MRTLIILRGLPGAGKTTAANLVGAGGAGYAHFEADMYFIEEGKYKFDASKLRNAHQWCQAKVEHAMLLNHTTGDNSTVIVSNTFTQEWEMDAYYKLAEQYGYRVYSLIVENRHGNKSVHNVPEETIEKMKQRFQVKL